VALVSGVSDEDDDDSDGEGDAAQNAQHHHHPHTGKLPLRTVTADSKEAWFWPCMFVYPSHHQSDFIELYGEDEMFALRMAQVFPDLEDCPDGATTVMPRDSENECACTNLALYFEVHNCDTATATWDAIHSSIQCGVASRSGVVYALL
jgi:hypothetical protein